MTHPNTPALKLGDRISDNDPRMTPRVLTIQRMTERHVYATSHSGIWARISRARIYTDGKPRRTGFSLETTP